jgi:hypothetical protein
LIGDLHVHFAHNGRRRRFGALKLDDAVMLNRPAMRTAALQHTAYGGGVCDSRIARPLDYMISRPSLFECWILLTFVMAGFHKSQRIEGILQRSSAKLGVRRRFECHAEVRWLCSSYVFKIRGLTAAVP